MEYGASASVTGVGVGVDASAKGVAGDVVEPEVEELLFCIEDGMAVDGSFYPALAMAGAARGGPQAQKEASP